MTNSRKIAYWITTVWLALGMSSTAIVQLMHLPEEVASFAALGYPIYLLNILGIWKILGVIVVLLPGMMLLKEWAYAGFFFAMSGAILSHLMTSGSSVDALPSLLLLTLTVASWWLRPVSRRITNQIVFK